MKTAGSAVSAQRTPRQSFLLLWAGQFLSGLGNGVTAFGLGIYVFRLSGSVTSFSLVILSLYLPSLLLKPIGGVLADRWNRRLLMICGDVGSGVSILTLVLLLASGSRGVVLVYILVAVSSAFSALREPAYKASITDLLSEAEYSRAAGLVQLAGAAQHLIAPLVAGLLMSSAGITAVLALDFSTFVLGVIATAVVAATGDARAQQRQGGSFGKELLQGFEVLWETRVLATVVLILAVVTVCVGFMQTLLHPMLLQITTPGTLGMIQSFAALGMLWSAILLGAIKITHGHYRLLSVGLLSAGLGMGVVGLTESLPVLTVALFVFFSALPFINAGAEVMMRSAIPNEKQGRAWGMIGLVTQSGYLVAYASSGFLADCVFEPIFQPNGAVPGLLRRLIGAGPGRGIGFMLGLSGIILSLLAVPIMVGVRGKPMVYGVNAGCALCDSISPAAGQPHP